MAAKKPVKPASRARIAEPPAVPMTAAGTGKLAKQRFEAGVSLDKIQPHPRNQRQGDVGAIHTSIVANDF